MPKDLGREVIMNRRGASWNIYSAGRGMSHFGDCVTLVRCPLWDIAQPVVPYVCKLCDDQETLALSRICLGSCMPQLTSSILTCLNGQVAFDAVWTTYSMARGAKPTHSDNRLEIQQTWYYWGFTCLHTRDTGLPRGNSRSKIGGLGVNDNLNLAKKANFVEGKVSTAEIVALLPPKVKSADRMNLLMRQLDTSSRVCESLSQNPVCKINEVRPVCS